MTSAGTEALSECPTCLRRECDCEEISHVYDGHRPSKRQKSSSKKTEISDSEGRQASRLANLPALVPTSTNTRSQILPRGLVLTRIGSKEPFRHSWSQWVGHTNDPTQLYKACFWSNGVREYLLYTPGKGMYSNIFMWPTIPKHRRTKAERKDYWEQYEIPLPTAAQSRIPTTYQEFAGDEMGWDERHSYREAHEWGLGEDSRYRSRSIEARAKGERGRHRASHSGLEKLRTKIFALSA